VFGGVDIEYGCGGKRHFVVEGEHDPGTRPGGAFVASSRAWLLASECSSAAALSHVVG